MDIVKSLIDKYTGEDTRKLADIDTSQKPGIVLALEDHVEDNRVSDFLFAITLDEQEFDLARIEALKILEVTEFRNLTTRDNAAEVICKVLHGSRDDDVKNYAAMAAAKYLDSGKVFQQIERILLDTKQPTDLRWNAFATIKLNGISGKSVALLKKMLSDDEFRESAERVLSEWR